MSSQQIDDNLWDSSSGKICSSCKTKNPSNLDNCAICGASLIQKEDSLYSETTKSIAPQTKYPEGKSVNIQRKRKKTKSNQDTQTIDQQIIDDLSNLFRKLKSMVEKSRSKTNATKYNYKNEIQKPLNLLGILAIVIILIFLANSLIGNREKSTTFKPNNQKTETKPEISLPKAPEGLFSYGGAPFYAPLDANGINSHVEEVYPGFEVRFTKPLNDDYSYTNGIKMLIDGELSFAFNGRPLNDREFKRASLRGIKLKQVPIAIDGIVFFGNNEISMNGLSLDRVKAIFQGEINNWSQVDPQMQKVPIVPVLLDDEDLEMIGVQKISSNSQYVDNYTQALRKVIATPGAVSFSSASLVKGQQLVTPFALADEDRINYVSPFINGNLNLADFKDGRYPLTRRIYIVYRDDQSLEEKAAEAYIAYLNSPEGQQIIQKSSFVPLR